MEIFLVVITHFYDIMFILGSMYAAGTSQTLISCWLLKHIWIDWQFQIFVQRSHTVIQLNIVKNPP
jgi:hypothetical protein